MNDLSVGIVTYNSGSELHYILDSLKNTRSIDFYVTVIDNISTDDSIPPVQSFGLNCKLILSLSMTALSLNFSHSEDSSAVPNQPRTPGHFLPVTS